MQTLPRPPHFLTWDCDHCRQPSDQWDWNPQPLPENGDVAPVYCTSCMADHVTTPEQRDALFQSLQSTNHQVRRLAELPYGTLIVCREVFGNRNDRGPERIPGLLYGVVVDAWDNVWPEDEWLKWHDGGVLLFLGGFVPAGQDSKGRDIPAGWLRIRSLQRPEDDPPCITFPADFSPTDEERKIWEQARGAFVELRERRGRPRGSDRFETAEDFERAAFAAVAVLTKRKRKPTQKNVGAQLIASRGRNRNSNTENPDRQFREWCNVFELEPGDLIQRAILACASGE